MIYESSAAYSFSHSKKKTETSFINSSMLTTPSMTKYYENIIIKPKSGYHFSKTPKLSYKRAQTPGPGAYPGAQKGKFGKEAPKYSMYVKDKKTTIENHINKKKREQTPGPNRYTITDENYNHTIGKKIITRKFGKSKKELNYDNKIPGVGQYNTTSSNDFGKSKKNKFTISKTNRKSIVDKSKNSSSVKNENDIKALDPGYYTLKGDFGNNAPKILLRGKPKEKLRSKTPGPGAYQQEEAKRKVMRKNPSSGIGFGKRMDFLGTSKKKFIPGPGKYVERKSDFDVSDVKKVKALKWSKTQRFKSIRSKTPGPGFYKVPCSFGNVPGYSGIDNSFRNV